MILAFVFGFLYLAVNGATADPLRRDCSNRPADVVFILDSSNSIWRRDFRKQTKFVADVVKHFNVGQGPTQTRVGILLFGHDVWPKIMLKNEFNATGLANEVQKLKHHNGKWTNTGKAINTAVKTMFTNDRTGVSRIAIVITDGRSQDIQATRDAAKLAHDSNIKTFVLGVGRRLDLKELSDIASDPDNEYLHLVENYSTLNKKLVETLATQACEVTERTPTTVVVPNPTEPTNVPSDQSLKNCGGKPADVFFAIDSSGSITGKDFNKELQFVQSVVKLFDVSNDKTRVGIINFSHMSQMILPLENNLNKQQLLSKIRNIDQIAGGTSTNDALKMIRRDGFRRDNHRPGVAKIAIVLTDGLSANEDLTKREAMLTQAAGVQVFAIGIGDGIDLREIQNIASDPDVNYVFQVNDFNSLETIKDLLAIKTCAAKPDGKEELPKDQPRCLVKRNTDMMFVYDSTALGPRKTDAISMFIATIVSNLDISSKHLHIGRITDNCPSGGNFELSNRLSAADFTSIGVSTFSDLIRKVKRTGFSSEYGGRSDATKSSILFIDSDFNGFDGSALGAAKDLTESSDVFVVAVGNSPTIRDFSRTFDVNKFLHVNSYDDLSSASNNFLNQLCYFITLNSFDYNLDYVDHVVPV